MKKYEQKNEYFMYFKNHKIQLFYRCSVDCPYKQEENFSYCGQKGFCELFHFYQYKIKNDKEMIFKYRF